MSKAYQIKTYYFLVQKVHSYQHIIRIVTEAASLFSGFWKANLVTNLLIELKVHAVIIHHVYSTSAIVIACHFNI